MTTENGIHLQIIWQDQDVLKLRVRASSGAFSGSVDVYVGPQRLAALAETLSGFPSSPSDKREVTLGSFGAESAGGGITLRFACTDRVGHARVEVIMEGDHNSRGDLPETAHFFMAVEAAAVDRFVPSLRKLATEPNEYASLEAAA